MDLHATTLVDGGVPARESTHYVWGTNLIKQSRGGQGTYYHGDGLGSVKALTDAQGSVTDRYEYEAFGEPAGHQGITTNPYRYTGEYFDDAITLQYNRARWYAAGGAVAESRSASGPTDTAGDVE